ASVIYFSMIVMTMLYLAMVLIGRRHWRGGRDGPSMGGHFTVRVIALIVITASVGVAAAAVPLFRWDVTSERLGSLLGESLELVEKARENDEPYVMKIEAFISKELPEEFVQRRTDLRSVLQEVKAVGGDRVKVRIFDDIDIFGEQANRAETTYGIRRTTTSTTVRGAQVSRDVIFGLAITYGLQRVVVPFMGETLPVEYELMRSLAIVTEKKRKTLGLLATDARWMGQNGPADASSQPLVAELAKQYEVKPVNPVEPITDKFDVLLALQPSSLGPDEMVHFIEAVKGGQATVIFEDPLPMTTRGMTPGTDQPRQAPRQMFPMMQQQQPEKGDIGKLWDLLGIRLFTAPSAQVDPFRRPRNSREETAVIFQEYSPHPDETFPDQFVWITPDCSEHGEPLNRDERVSADLQKLLLPFPGAILNVGKKQGRKFTKLITTGTRSGWVRYSDCMSSMFGQRIQDVDDFEELTGKQYTLAAAIHIQGKEKAAEGSPDQDIDVAIVADMDFLDAVFFMIRERGSLYGEQGLRWQLDNVPFALNIIDEMAGEDRFTKIRSRRPKHRELLAIKRLTDLAKSQRNQSRKDTEKKFKKIIEEAKDELIGINSNPRVPDSQAQQLDKQAVLDRLGAQEAQLNREQKEEYHRIDNKMAADIHEEQDWYKLLAVLLPPILPLLIAICVFFFRRSQERDSVQASRLR
ncbi:MAG: GldG family protein, partial [Planctomycetales bacterium]